MELYIGVEVTRRIFNILVLTGRCSVEIVIIDI